MADDLQLRENYILAKCCRPRPGQAITGYCSHDCRIIKVHRTGCLSLERSPKERLVSLEWSDILDAAEPAPGEDFVDLDELDFRILSLHRKYGVDYSLKVARMLHVEKATVFEHHRKLRVMGLVERVEPLIIQYRKGIVDNKWIKHRNHTYYRLTEKGLLYLDYRCRDS